MDSMAADDKVNSSGFPGQGEPSVTVVGDSGLRLGNVPHELVLPLPLPGIVIFVHGVNSDGEWYQAAEEGLCKGLNTRLKRESGQILHDTAEGGQMTPVKYLKDLTPDGYINPLKTGSSFIESGSHFSPVIQFRWGYKASQTDLQLYGNAIFLNEKNYWGGGPFANGCTALPDLWGTGLNDQLFLWLHAQHFNPTNNRMVYACPPRPYYVLAALRLAKLIQSIREKQADVPVTIVCHSQGNMVSLAAAFLGDRIGSVTDAEGKAGRCVADAYVLCNPPYSLLPSNLTEGWTQLGMKDAEGKTGRQTLDARVGTLKNFFKIMRQQASNAQKPELIDEFMANDRHQFKASQDRVDFGHGPNYTNYGRVTLYFNPHDQVISATTIQGIGWRGMSATEITATGGSDVFCQRVFAEGFLVGNTAEKKSYHFWKDHHGKGLKPGDKSFWYPTSQLAKYSIQKGKEANEHAYAEIATVAFAPLFYLVTSLFRVEINGLPEKDWETPLQAPNLKKPFMPQSVRFGHGCGKFDMGIDAPGQSRNSQRTHSDDDPYKSKHVGPGIPIDAAQGNEDSESELRYEHHAVLRMQAKREGMYKTDALVAAEDDLSIASDSYKKWRTNKIEKSLAENADAPATDHSSIMTNPEHAEKALAYDIPVGICRIENYDMDSFRAAADWRYLETLEEGSAAKLFAEYFLSGRFNKQKIDDWAKSDKDGVMPTTIVDKRAFFGS